MIVKLRAIGSIETKTFEGDTDRSIEREALLVYAGDFDSQDGPVTVTLEHVAKLVANHNSYLARIKRTLAGDVPLKNCPPVQLDHSRSGWDTVGRLVGDIYSAAYELQDGTTTVGVFGRLRILGAENVERVVDGRWTNLSLGADFEAGKISELTITPFPAADEASLLSKPETEPTKETSLDTKKLKKYLMERKGMSDEDATAHLASFEGDKDKLSKLSEEVDEDEKRLSAENTEKEEKEKKEVEAKLTAARGKITELSSGFNSLVSKAKLQARQGRILTRLSKLRAAAKITPAEIRKMDIAKLSASDDNSIELVLKTYEDREPVIHVGQFGSVKAADISRLSESAAKEQRMSKLEAETRANMSLLKGTVPKGAKRLSDAAPDSVNIHVDTDPHTDTAYLESEYGEVCKMFAEGRAEEAKTRLKAFMTKALVSTGSSDVVEANAEETERQLSALAESVSQMQASFDGMQKLAASLAGA